VGLIEVFAPQPNAFGSNENTVIRNLAEAVSSVLRPPMPSEGIAERAIELDDEVYQGRDENAAKRVLPRYQIVLLVLVAITLSLVVIWLIRSEPVKSPADSGGDRSKASSDGSAVIRANAAPPLHGIDEVRRLAEQGDSSAEFAYGVHYFAGENVPQDYTEAVRWFSKAAEQNNVMAQSTLAACYWAGQGVPQDFNKAYFWAVIAQAGGDEASKSRVALLASRMNHVEVVEAQQQADEWIHQHQIARAVPPATANESDNPGGR
jgi:hypothetical protein